MKFSSDGSLLAVGTDNAVILYNVEQQTKLTSVLCALMSVHAVMFPSSFLLGTEQEGRKANHARSVVISPGNKLLAAGSEDNYIRVREYTIYSRVVCLHDLGRSGTSKQANSFEP